MFPIIDLHCDLLAYLQKDKLRTPYDCAVRCAIPQLRKGGVKLQTMAIFTETGKDSSKKGFQQAQIYEKLPLMYPQEFVHFSQKWTLEAPYIGTFLAIENASGFCDEEETLEEGLSRLKQIVKIASPLYISLTWNTENRFGGGVLASHIGLKSEGKILLEELHQQQIAIDLSHASDALAYDIIDYIEGHGLEISLIASHSNARQITPELRNLPDDIAIEIFRRKGVVGLNLYRFFIGETEDYLVKHLAHWLELGGEEQLAFGADFFNDADISSVQRRGKQAFFPAFQEASCYPTLLSLLQKELKLKSEVLENLAYRNILNFVDTLS